MKFAMKLVLSLGAFALMFGGLAVPAEASRPLMTTQVKCIPKKTCLIMKARDCWTVRDIRTGEIDKGCSRWYFVEKRVVVR